MKNIVAYLFLTLLCVGFADAQSKTKQTSSPTYTGAPETDKAFAPFISKNLGRVVYLNLTIEDTGWITDGYRGVQSMINGAKTNGIDYSYFLECDQNPDADTAIGQCGNLVKWNESTGKLLGYFKVLRITKTGVRNYRAVFLAPMKK
jgi:hypothetical protein